MKVLTEFFAFIRQEKKLLFIVLVGLGLVLTFFYFSVDSVTIGPMW